MRKKLKKAQFILVCGKQSNFFKNIIALLKDVEMYSQGIKKQGVLTGILLTVFFKNNHFLHRI